MRKRISLTQKLKLSLTLITVFLLVLTINRLDHKHFSTVKKTVNSVFEDRLVAQDYIYKLNNLFKEKQLALNTNNSPSIHFSENSKITELITAFSLTKLTTEEAIYFKDLQENFSELQRIEKSNLNSDINLSELRKKLNLEIDEIMIDMNNLSATQLTEGKQLTTVARQSLNMNNIISNLEITFLIIIGIVIQIIVFSPNKSIQNAKENYWLQKFNQN